MSTSEFDDYKVDHLFLLIGENPLPNYVAAKLLINKGGTAYLVHTTDTQKSASGLRNILRNELIGLKDIELRSLNDYESDAYYIQKEINEKLRSIESGQIGLNYTGGTKAMSAHSYRALFYEEIKDKTNKTYQQREGVIFSYLDARRLEMCIDKEDKERVHLPIKPDTLQVELKRLFELHRLELKNSPTQETLLPELVKELATVFADEVKVKDWFKWFCDDFYPQVYREKANNKGDWKNETSLKEALISLEKLPQELIKAFKEEKFTG